MRMRDCGGTAPGKSVEGSGFVESYAESRRANAVEALPVVRRLRIGEFELGGGDCAGAAQDSPVAQGQREIRCRQDGESCAVRAGEDELKRAAPGPVRVS